MKKAMTLLEFLETTGADVTVYDIGRRLSRISRDDFIKIENQQIPYPYPLQQQAWFGLSILDRAISAEPVIWFLRFPLEETGKLQLAGRDYFIHRLFEAAAAKQSKDDTQLSADALKDNPHVFKPRDDKMAVFHARLSKQLKQPASRFYQHTLEYLSGSQGWEQWSFVGFQGIADVVERLSESNNNKLLLDAIAHLPAQPLEAFCQCLENIRLDAKLTQAMQIRLDSELSATKPDASVAAHLLRAVSQSVSETRKTAMFEALLNSSLANDETVLGAVAARCWHWLEQDEKISLYLLHLSQASQEVFNSCLSDLLFMPKLRDKLLAQIRSPQRPDSLAIAFNEMLKSYAQ